MPGTHPGRRHIQYPHRAGHCAAAGCDNILPTLAGQARHAEAGRACQGTAGLQHPNIVNVFDVGEDNGIYYIVMELIVGITLKKYIERKKQLPVKEAVSILIQVSQGIEAAHNNHIIHRDIKPQNIIISKEGKVKVTDFGIARAASANTISSNAMGSVHYISPEQAKGGFVDEKSDIYSLGITLYEMLTGHVPFDGDSTVTIALQHVQNEIPSAKEYVPDLPVSVEKIIEKCTQKKPDRRYLKVSSLIADLKHSLIAPDEDFVKIVTGVDETSATRKITDEEVAEIRKKSGFEKPELDIPVINKDNEVIDDDDDDIKDDLEDFDDESNPKLDKIIAIGGIVTAVIILVIVAFLVISIAGNGCSSGKKTGSSGSTALDANHTKVPKLEGLSKQEAIDALKNATLGYVIEQDYDDKVKEGYVISASKEKGDIVKKHTTITLVISRGGKKFDIPDVVGKTKDEAKQILEDKGLKVKIVYEKSDSIPIDQVMKCDPVAPTQVAAGDEITLTVSSGTDATFVKVPNLQGMTETAAKATLDAQKLKLGTVSEEFNDSIQEGKICRQDVEAKSDVTEGSTINVWISKGRDPQVTVPNVVGMSQDAAKAALEQAGLKLGNISQTENTAPAGQVISQTVAANSKANRDTAVDIAVSTGKQETTTPEQKPVQTPKEPEKKQEETTTTPQASSSITISVWDKNSPDKAVQSTNVTAPGSYTFPVDASMNESDITVLVNKKPAKFKYSNGQVVVDVTENDFK